MAKLRNVGGALVVTLTQAILNTLEMQDGDRLLLESLPPYRVIITKEIETMPNSKRIELELQVLEAKHTAVEKEFTCVIADNKLGSDWPDDLLEAEHARVERDKANLHVQIAEKRLELFDLQGQ